MGADQGQVCGAHGGAAARARHWRSRRAVRARRRRGQRGSVIVEAAIFVPLLVLLTFGAIEFGLAFRESAAVKNSTRAGTRIASAMPRNDAYIDATRKAVSSAIDDLGHAKPLEMWIYRVPPGNTNTPQGGACTTNCVSFSWNAATRQFDAASMVGDPWLGAEQNACVDSANPNVPDRVGVYVKARHDFITGLFGSAKTLESRSVMRIEPFVGDGACG